MPVYNPPLRDMQFVMHEVLNVSADFQTMPQHAEMDADTINAVLEEAGKFASQVIFPLNISGDTEGCQLDRTTHEVKTPAASRKPTRPIPTEAGRLSVAIPSTAARACRWWSTSACTR